jgi:hypothetical protein
MDRRSSHVHSRSSRPAASEGTAALAVLEQEGARDARWRDVAPLSSPTAATRGGGAFSRAPTSSPLQQRGQDQVAFGYRKMTVQDQQMTGRIRPYGSSANNAVFVPLPTRSLVGYLNVN